MSLCVCGKCNKPKEVSSFIDKKGKQHKIMQYYRRSFKSQLAPVREITRPRRTRKLKDNSSTNAIANGTGRIPKLTKTQMPEKENSQDKDKEQNINLEKSEITKQPTYPTHHTHLNQKGGDNQYVVMD